MSHNTLPTVAELSGEMRERLAKVKYVFTDLDATMLAPGSCVLRDNDGNPSTKLVEAVVALARAGIQVVPTSGRNRTMIHEDARVLGLNSYIGEMGGLVMYDLKANDWEYLTGDMPYDPACGLTPHQVIEQTGVCEKILARWPHKIEYHNDMSTGYKYREVTVGMRGDVPDDEVQASGRGRLRSDLGLQRPSDSPVQADDARARSRRGRSRIQHQPRGPQQRRRHCALLRAPGDRARGDASRSAIPVRLLHGRSRGHVLPSREWPDERRRTRVPGCLRERFRYARQNCRRLGGDGRAAGRGAFVARRRCTWTCLFERDW
ncbi:MAG: HAD family hydrolase [Collinsella sp.]